MAFTQERLNALRDEFKGLSSELHAFASTFPPGSDGELLALAAVAGVDSARDAFIGLAAATYLVSLLQQRDELNALIAKVEGDVGGSKSAIAAVG